MLVFLLTQPGRDICHHTAVPTMVFRLAHAEFHTTDTDHQPVLSVLFAIPSNRGRHYREGMSSLRVTVLVLSLGLQVRVCSMDVLCLLLDLEGPRLT